MNSPNPHLGGDALAFLNEIVPDTPETRLVERQELFRLTLTQAMRNVRTSFDGGDRTLSEHQLIKTDRVKCST